MNKAQIFGATLLRLLYVVAFALCFSGLAQAQQSNTLTVTALPSRNEGLSQQFRVTLNNVATQRLTFRFDTFAGAGDFGALELPQGPFEADYTGVHGDATIEVGTSAVTVNVPTTTDQSYEFDETFTVRITNPRYNGQIAGNVIITGGGTATGTILNDDNPPTITLVRPPAILEGDSNNLQRQNYNFTVDISDIAGRPLNLVFSTSDVPGGATSSGASPDYVGVTNAPIQIPAGSRQFTYTITVLGDDIYEGDEAFNLTASYSPMLPGTSSTTTMGVITDNDLPSYRIDDSLADVNEGEEAVFVIRLVDRTGGAVAAKARIDFNYTLQDGSAQKNIDFTDPQGGTFTILPGESEFRLRVPTIDDNALEQVETFILIINSSTNTIAPANNIGNGSITDNDVTPVITVGDAQVVEGTGGTNSISFTASLTASSGQTVSVDYQTVSSNSGAANTRATAGQDYTAVPTTRLTFAANQTTKTFSIPITTDSVNELDETFRVRLFNPANANFSNDAAEIFATGTIIDDDPAGTVSLGVETMDVVENVNGRIVNIPVNFVPNGTPARPVTVDFTTVAGTAVQAGQRDYFGKSGRITFGPGVTAQNIPIEIINDSIREGDETFTVRLTAANGATLVTPIETVVTIKDDDAVPTVSVFPASPIREGEGSKNFVVALSGQSQSPFTVNYSFVNGTAINGLDFTGTDGTLTFTLGGPRSFFVSAAIADDNIAEENETFSLVLSKDQNDTSFNLQDGATSSTVTIVDNDSAPALTISDAQILEGSTGDITTASSLNFNVSLTRASSRPVSFTYSTLNLRQPDCTPANGCDVASNDDYASVRDVVVTFAPGETTKTISVVITPDKLNEYNEQFSVVARSLVNTMPSVTTNAAGVTRFGTVAFGTIINDDAGGVITVTGPTANIVEGYNRGGGNVIGDVAEFVVTLPTTAGRAVTVNYTLTGSADAADINDITTGPGRGQVTFFPGTTTRTISLRAIADALDEPLESLVLTISIDDNNGANRYITNPSTSTARTNIVDRTPGVTSFTPNVGFPAYGSIAATRVTINGNQLRTDGNPRVAEVIFPNGAIVGRGGIQYTNDNTIVVGVPGALSGTNNPKTGPLSLRLIDGTTVLPLPLVNGVAQDFVVQPVIDSFTPTTAVPGATSITITGRNFNDGNNAVTGVQFSGGVTVPVTTPDSDTKITVTVPSGAANGALRIVSAKGGVGPASQAQLAVTQATAGGLSFGANLDTSTIVEDSGGGNISRPALNFDGVDNNTTHRPYLVFLNPARQSGGPNSSAAIRPQNPVNLRFEITDSTSRNGAGNVAPLIAVRADLTNAGRPTFLQNSGANGRVEVTLPAGYNTDNPIEVFITYAGKDTLPPIVGGGASASVTVNASIFGAADNEILFPNTGNNNKLFVTIGRREIVNSSNQTAIAFSPGTTNSFSVPFSTNNAGSVAQTDVFNTAPGATTYTVYRFDVSNQRNNRVNGDSNSTADFKALAPGDRLQRGVGYRLVTAANSNVQLRTRGTGLQTITANSFSLNLTRNIPFAATASNAANATNGYNFIGFPFDNTQVSGVNFNNSRVIFNGSNLTLNQAVAAGLINPQLFTVDASGALTPVSGDQVIMPFQAYFVQIFRDNLTLQLNR